MKWVVVSSSEWTYPDVFDYPTASNKAHLHVARNSYATAQIILKGVPDKVKININIKGELASFDFKWYEMIPIYVEDNPHIEKQNIFPNFPTRWAPFYIYDCLKPLGDTVTPMNGTVGLYFMIRITPDTIPGIMEGHAEISLGDEFIIVPIEVTIYKAIVPSEENLKIIIGYNSTITAKYHNVVPGSDEHKQLDIKYLRMLRHMRQNMLYIPSDTIKSEIGQSGKYIFDFSKMIEFVERAMSLGYKYFNAPSVGRRKSWKMSTILVGPNLEAMSYEAYQYLSQYLPQLRKVLIARGWIDNFYMGICDEPNEANAIEYRALCGLVRKFAPDIKLIDAVSYGSIHGAIDVWVPLNSEYDKHQQEFESYRSNGDEIWFYVCCIPRGEGYINRFMDYPLLSTRYLFWGNYKYNLSGFLHWAANQYQPNQNPFTVNCPLHRNCDAETILPPGDTHIIYPGEGEPWMSMRLEAHRQSAEEYELFRLLSLNDKKLADNICSKGFRSFKDVEYDPIKFENIKIELLKAVSCVVK